MSRPLHATAARSKQIRQSRRPRHIVPLPPLDEQRRIAAILDKADALRRKRERALDSTRSLPNRSFWRCSAIHQVLIQTHS